MGGTDQKDVQPAQPADEMAADLLSRAERIAGFGSWQRNYATGAGRWSDGMFRLFGLRPREGAPPYEDVLSLIHPEDRQTVVETNRRLAEEGGSAQLTYRIVRPDGRERILRAHVEASRNEVGQPVLTGVDQDVTERVRAQRELLDREEKYRTVVEHANEGICILQDGIVRFANRYIAEMLGYSPEEGLGISFDAYVHPSAVEVLRQSHQRFMAGQDDEATYEVPLLHRDGYTIAAEFNMSPTTYDGRRAGLLFVRDIARRKVAEEALRASERERAAILDGMSELVLFQDGEGRIIWANRAAAQSVGAESEELVGRCCYEVWHGRDAMREDCPVARALEARRPARAEMSSPDGRTWLVNASPVYDGEGELLGVVEVVLEVTHRRRIEQALRESEEKYRTLVESSLQGILVVRGEEPRIVFANQAAAEVFGLDVDGLLALAPGDALDFVHPDDRDVLLKSYLERLRGGTPPPPYETRIVRRDGSVRWVAASTTHVSYGGEPAVQAALLDVTERKAAEQELRESEARFRMIYETTPLGYQALDGDGQILDVNPPWLEMMGYERDEVIGRPFAELLAGASRQRLADSLERLRDSGEARDVDLEMVRKDGARLVGLFNAAASYDADGSLSHMHSFFQDITERKEAEERTARRAEALERQTAPHYEMIGESPAMLEVYEFIRKVAPTDAGVLVCGESGTGKEMIVRAIHRQSGRADGPLEVVNCAAMPPTLLEDELFGHVKGAFTGAVADKPGRFELADGGTLFLDEVVELPPECQAKLLRVLEEGCVRRVGDVKDRPADVRVVAATNRDPARALEEGRLRRDLFYRLDRLRVVVPPLREREGDLPLLAGHFLSIAAASLRGEAEGFAPGALELFVAYRWPGNVRELKNVVERMIILGEGPVLEPELVPEDIREAVQHGKGALPPLSEVKRRHVLRVLDACEGNKSRAAEMLGIDRSTLYARLNSYEHAET
jgi:PAS domain S-box-containing protein